MDTEHKICSWLFSPTPNKGQCLKWLIPVNIQRYLPKINQGCREMRYPLHDNSTCRPTSLGKNMDCSIHLELYIYACNVAYFNELAAIMNYLQNIELRSNSINLDIYKARFNLNSSEKINLILCGRTICLWNYIVLVINNALVILCPRMPTKNQASILSRYFIAAINLLWFPRTPAWAISYRLMFLIIKSQQDFDTQEC